MNQFMTDLKKYFYYSIYTAKVDLKAEVANSYLNWIWWLLEPFCEMLIFTYVFGVLFAHKEQFFPVYIYSGLIMWNFFSRTINYSVSLVRKNKSIITKVYLPKFVLLLENMFLNMFKMLISCGILFLLMIFYKVPLSPKILMIIPVYITFAVLCFGLGNLFLHFGVFIDDLSYVVSILLRLLFYISGVFYDIESRFSGTASKILGTVNPVAMLLKAMHDVLLYCKMPNWRLLGIWFFISIIISILGLKIVYKYENSYVKVI